VTTGEQKKILVVSMFHILEIVDVIPEFRENTGKGIYL